MEAERLRESLERLRTEVRLVDDERSKAKLNDLIEEVERRLEEPDEERHANVLESVRDAIEHFEVHYPNATTLLNHVMVSLSKMGL